MKRCSLKDFKMYIHFKNLQIIKSKSFIFWGIPTPRKYVPLKNSFLLICLFIDLTIITDIFIYIKSINKSHDSETGHFRFSSILGIVFFAIMIKHFYVLTNYVLAEKNFLFCLHFWSIEARKSRNARKFRVKRQ